MSEVNGDAALVEGVSLVRRGETLVEMSKGCICCTLRDDLLKEVWQLAEQRCFDYLLIESSSISEPLLIIRYEHGNCLADVARLDTMVTVVDGANLVANTRPSNLSEIADKPVKGTHPKALQLASRYFGYEMSLLADLSNSPPDANHVGGRAEKNATYVVMVTGHWVRSAG